MLNNNYACWATVLAGQNPDANGPQPVEFIGGSPYVLRFRTPSDSVVTTVTATDGYLRRSVTANASATEQIPSCCVPPMR